MHLAKGNRRHHAADHCQWLAAAFLDPCQIELGTCFMDASSCLHGLKEQHAQMPATASAPVQLLAVLAVPVPAPRADGISEALLRGLLPSQRLGENWKLEQGGAQATTALPRPRQLGDPWLWQARKQQHLPVVPAKWPHSARSCRTRASGNYPGPFAPKPRCLSQASFITGIDCLLQRSRSSCLHARLLESLMFYHGGKSTLI